MLAFAGAVGLCLRLVVGPLPTSTILLAAGCTTLFLVVAITVGRGLPSRVGAALVVLGLLAAVILIPLQSDGFSTPILFLLPVIPSLAARLLGREGPAAALLVSLFGIGALLLSDGPVLAESPDVHPPSARALLLGIAVVLGAMFAHSTERRWRAGHRRLGTTEARYRLLFERSQDPVIMTSLDGRILDLNEAAMTTLGFADLEQARRISVADLYVEPSSREEVLDELRATGSIKQRFSRLRDQQGRELVIAASTVAETAPDGEMTTLLTIFRDVTREHLREADLREQARRDPLTGLSNRRWFEERLGEALERSARYLEQAAVLLLDLDGFKRVNDAHGHPVGDAVLQVVGERLAGIVRRIDTVARLGGDEFAIINTRATPDGVRTLADRLVAALEVPIHLDGEDFRISGCVGIAFCPPISSDPDRPTAGRDTVVERADRALYKAKARGPGQIEIAPVRAATGKSTERPP